MRITPALAASLGAALVCAPALAHEPIPEPPPVAAAEGQLPAGTVVQIQLAQSLSSKTSKRGDRFPITLVKPLVSEAGVLAPAGATGVGEVVSAAPRGRGGQAGELVLAARYIEYGGRQIPLRGLKLAVSGADATQRTNWCKAITLYCSTQSTDVEAPIGVIADAKLAADISMPIIAPPPEPAPAAQTDAPPALPSETSNPTEDQ